MWAYAEGDLDWLRLRCLGGMGLRGLQPFGCWRQATIVCIYVQAKFQKRKVADVPEWA